MNKRPNLEFVLIPKGEFIVGSNRSRDKHAGADEVPQHRLACSDFYIMRYPVTNAQYLAFVQDSGHRVPMGWTNSHYPEGKPDHPVTGVTVHDAVAFCRWAARQTGLPLRLPTEVEWEKAARGPDGRLYPWGDNWDPSRCNNRETKSTGTSPAGAFSPAGDSPYGVADMAGNVQEWCSSLFGEYPYDPGDGREHYVYQLDRLGMLPQVHESGAIANPERLEASLGKQCIRGGSWRGSRDQSRCAYRSWAAPMHKSDDTGFRLCYE